ncbi:MAG: hypothetical protein RL757_820 [Bacteroidota bacterium]|jgi:hypothetical protein
MLNFEHTQIARLAITWSGNRERNEGTVIPKSTLVPVTDYAEEILLNAFIKPFAKEAEFFYFHDEEDVSHNAVYQACVEIFQNPESLSEQAAILTERLYQRSNNPKLTGGEIFVCLLNDLQLFTESVTAIGIFKTVSKDSFLKVDRTAEAFTLQIGEGISTGKIALGALIFGVDEAEGFRLVMRDSVSKKDDTPVWREFLGVQPIEDNYFLTQQYMTIASDFIQDKARHAFGLNRAESADLLNRSALYFKENDIFDDSDFKSTLFPDEEQQAAFNEFKTEASETAGLSLDSQFDISKQAVRKSARIFKSVIKLDENFQIYVKGRRDLIERGFDEEKGKSYYKVFFDQEE